MIYTADSMSIMIALVSFLGFWLENFWLLFTKGYMDNRNMNLPFLLGYGLVVAGMYIVMGTPEKMKMFMHPIEGMKRRRMYMLYFFSSMLIVMLGELALGTIIENLFGFEYWNYNTVPMHITKYTSIPTSIGFAFIITIFMDKFFEPIMKAISSMPPKRAHKLGIVLLVMMIADFIICFIYMGSTHDTNRRWIKRVGEALMIIR